MHSLQWLLIGYCLSVASTLGKPSPFQRGFPHCSVRHALAGELPVQVSPASHLLVRPTTSTEESSLTLVGLRKATSQQTIITCHSFVGPLPAQRRGNQFLGKACPYRGRRSDIRHLVLSKGRAMRQGTHKNHGIDSTKTPWVRQVKCF